MSVLAATNVFDPGALRIVNLATLGFVVVATLGLELAVGRWRSVSRLVTDQQSSETNRT